MARVRAVDELAQTPQLGDGLVDLIKDFRAPRKIALDSDRVRPGRERQ
jgi:hypothetical protein